MRNQAKLFIFLKRHEFFGGNQRKDFTNKHKTRPVIPLKFFHNNNDNEYLKSDFLMSLSFHNIIIHHTIIDS